MAAAHCVATFSNADAQKRVPPRGEHTGRVALPRDLVGGGHPHRSFPPSSQGTQNHVIFQSLTIDRRGTSVVESVHVPAQRIPGRRTSHATYREDLDKDPAENGPGRPFRTVHRHVVCNALAGRNGRGCPGGHGKRGRGALVVYRKQWNRHHHRGRSVNRRLGDSFHIGGLPRGPDWGWGVFGVRSADGGKDTRQRGVHRSVGLYLMYPAGRDRNAPVSGRNRRRCVSGV